jgi:putative ABC transport system permease protein
MFARILKGSLIHRQRPKLAAVLAVALGASVATAMLAIALGIGDKVNRELRSYGANIEALPRQRSLPINIGGTQYKAVAPESYLDERDLPKLKTIFWANNIIAFAPFLHVPVKLGCNTSVAADQNDVEAMLIGTWLDHDFATEDGKTYRTGVRELCTWWKVDGSWPNEGECLIGANLAKKLRAEPGGEVTINVSRSDRAQTSARLKISGILLTGSDEDNAIVTELDVVGRLAGLEGKLDRVEISALTHPEDDFARRDPSQMSAEDYERWSCTPYARSIAQDVASVLKGAEAHPVLRVSQTEGVLLAKINLMILLIAVAALAAAVLAVASTMMTTVIERKTEIGLLKAIGASSTAVMAIFLAEASIIGVCGGIIGLAAGYELARVIAQAAFGSAVAFSRVLALMVIAISIAVALVGSAVPLRTVLKLDSATVLSGRA